MPDFDKTLGDVITIAQTLLRAEKDKSKITSDLIEEKVTIAAMVLSPTDPFAVDRPAATAELIRRFSHWIGKDTTLQDVGDHEPWLVAARKKDWRYWQRYQSYLERKLADDVVEALNISTDQILGLLEDPKRVGSWDRRGLVVGHVQSGKTGNYSGLICKAADAGYKVIIVLAGMHNNLRSQTQIRLEESFLGYETSANRDPGKPLGVAEIDSDPKIHPHCATTRADNGDFNVNVAKHFAISPEERPWLFVVKKNKTVLTQLLKWIRGHVADATETGTGRRIVTNLPLLVIDDEADNASVDTGEQSFDADGRPDEEHQPKTINSLIRKILHAFSKSAYVGYTATPFANIFIHRKGSTTEEGPDLFPQSFIHNLSAPSNYVGPAKLFGRQGPDGRTGGLPLTREIEDHFDAQELTGWIPPSHRKDHVPIYAGQETLPPSLKEAIGSYVIACAVRVFRGQGAEHSSMLVHVTRFVHVQNEVRSQVEDYVKRMRQRIARGIDDELLLSQLRNLWDRDFQPTSAAVADLAPEAGAPLSSPSWEHILTILPDVLFDVEVRSVNGTAKDALDYSEKEGIGLKVIAIGGDKLARGLTLEGLVTSYFVRTTKMYDTLMQMGRWFGYRPGYVDLCRLYTTADLIEWFGHIADASEELREEFDIMVDRNATPNEYGLKVQSHPVLTVTSPLKMRSAETLSLSYSGSLSQLIVFYRDAQRNLTNLQAADRLVSAIGTPTESGPSRDRGESIDNWKRSHLWTDVRSEHVVDFLTSFSTHPRANRANSAVIADFIRRMNDVGQLKLWTVAVLSEGERSHLQYTFSTGLKVIDFPTRSATVYPDRFSIGVLTESQDEGIDLDCADWKRALQMTLNHWTRDPARGQVKAPKRPSGKMIRLLRGAEVGATNRGILLLYPLAILNKDDKTPLFAGGVPTMAFAVGFPSSDSGVKVEYKVDHLYWEREYGPAE